MPQPQHTIPPKAEWIKVYQNLKRGAEDCTMPLHAKWCKGQLKFFVARMQELGMDPEAT